MLTMVHSNPVRISDGILYVDRKFLIGMQYYCASIDMPVTTVHPVMRSDEKIMDEIGVPIESLPFDVIAVNRELPTRDKMRLEAQVQSSVLVYGYGLNFAQLARKCNTPYILVLEYDLKTKVAVSQNQVGGRLRRAVRAAKEIFRYCAYEVPAMRGAHSLHCNGYPVYEESVKHNSNRLLYLDSRMGVSELMPESILANRLRSRKNRSLRLIFSGRYEHIKGAVDAVQVAIECQRKGLDVELHTFGQGSLRQAMDELAGAAPSPERIHIHDAIPFPELVVRSREFDLFVSCHTQSDPSCTYLETLGAGLPIVGYGNKMLKRVCEHSKAGIATDLGRPELVADSIEYLSCNPEIVDLMSLQARKFCSEHLFEDEFSLRVAAINKVLMKTLSAK